MRKYYLDNIRWCTVLLVAVYHVFYLFNACGVPAGVGSFAPVQPQDSFLTFVYPWFMVLLFAIAGMSARYALERKSAGEFIKTRTVKLLVPATLGLLVFQWTVGWLNVYIGGGLEPLRQTVPVPARYLIFALSGTGPLWFAQMLWIFSLVLVLIRKLDKADKLYDLCGKVHPLILLLFGALLWASSLAGNLPMLTMYRFGIYGMAFLLGYFFLSHDKNTAFYADLAPVAIPVALAAGTGIVIRWFGQDYTADAFLHNYVVNCYAWLAVLTILGSGRRWLDKETAFTARMTRSSYGVYVLHYLFALVSCWVLKTYTALPVPVIYLLAIVLTLVGSFGCYELLRRIPVVRWCVLGMGGKRKK